MKKIMSFMLVAGTSLLSANAQQADDGFKWLFDGKTTHGWHIYNHQSNGAAWQVTEGLLHFNAQQKNKEGKRDGGDLVTDEVFENFHLKLEWKIEKGGNSGIMFNIQEDTAYKYPWMTGPEMQVLDNAGHTDAKIHKHQAGDLYDLIACSQDVVKPAGEWNKAEIVFTGNQLELIFNGVSVVKTSYGDDAWQLLVAGSKFKSMPGFGKFSNGRIGLQDHGDNVWYRNIQMKRL